MQVYMLLSAFQNIYISNLLSKAVSAAPAMFHFFAWADQDIFDFVSNPSFSPVVINYW